jgi:hypothetical protein
MKITWPAPRVEFASRRPRSGDSYSVWSHDRLPAVRWFGRLSAMCLDSVPQADFSFRMRHGSARPTNVRVADYLNRPSRTLTSAAAGRKSSLRTGRPGCLAAGSSNARLRAPTCQRARRSRTHRAVAEILTKWHVCPESVQVWDGGSPGLCERTRNGRSIGHFGPIGERRPLSRELMADSDSYFTAIVTVGL